MNKIVVDHDDIHMYIDTHSIDVSYRKVIEHEEVQYEEVYDDIYMNKIVVDHDDIHMYIDSIHIDICTLITVECMDIYQHIDIYSMIVVDSVHIQYYEVCNDDGIEEYFISKDDMDSILEMEEMINERRNKKVIKEGLVVSSLNLDVKGRVLLFRDE